MTWNSIYSQNGNGDHVMKSAADDGDKHDLHGKKDWQLAWLPRCSQHEQAAAAAC
jgi:hypothetical protein